MDKETKQNLSPTERIRRYREIESLQLKRILAFTPAQRLAWLEEALDFAYITGARKPILSEWIRLKNK